MIKILHIIDSGGLYGAEVVVLTLIEESIRMGHYAILGSLSDPGLDQKPIETEALRRGLPFKRFEMGTFPGSKSVGRILRAIREENIDIVHTHGYKANVLFGLLPRILRPFPVVSTLHGWCSTRRLSKLRLFEWLDSRTLGCHDAVVVVSLKMLELPVFRSRNLPLLSVIPNAAATLSSDHSVDEGSAGIEAFCQRGYTFGSVGRLSTEKNFIALLEALVLLQSKGLDAQLLIMGEGRLRPVLAEYVQQHDLTEKVMMPGYIANASRFLPFLDAFVLSSTTEGMPISILEAMTAGVPIVSTIVGEVPEMLGHGAAGLLVEPGDVPALADAMGRLLSELELRQRLADEARRIVEERYSTGAMAQSYIHLYHRALQARSGGAESA